MLKRPNFKNSDINPKPVLDATFRISDEQSMDQFWFFMMREEGVTKSIEFILHICSEVLAVKKRSIAIKCRIFNYVSHFIVTDELFCKTAIAHYERIKSFISLEVCDKSVHIKSLRDLDLIDCNFCSAMKDDDRKIIDSTKNIQSKNASCNMIVSSAACKKSIGFTDCDESEILEREIFEGFRLLEATQQMHYLHRISIKIFIYSQKLLASVELYGISQILRSLSFTIQKLYFTEYPQSASVITLSKNLLADTADYRNTISKAKPYQKNDFDIRLKQIQDLSKQIIFENG